jgi:hypothetical protein
MLLGSTAIAAGMGNQAFGQLEFWGLVSRYGFQEGSAIALQAGEPSLQVAGSLGPTCWLRVPGVMVVTAGSGEQSLRAAGVLGLIAGVGFLECSSMALLPALEN